MRIGLLTRLLLTPLSDEMGGGGSGGGLIGAGITSSTPSTPSGTNVGTSGSGGTPAPISLSDDSYVNIPGQKDPIKFSDWKARFVDKGDFTRTTQQYATREKQYQAELQRLRDSAARAQQNPPAQGGNPLADRLKALGEQPYVDGKAAVQIVTDLYQTAIGPLAEAIKQRDQALALMYKKLQGIETTAQTLSSRTSAGDFKSLLSQTKQSVGLPDDPAVEEFLQDVYLSHEGSDLNREFPNMVRARFEALAKVVRALDKKAAQDARQRAVGIPTRGGSATPGQPLRQGHRSAAERANDLWASMTGEPT